MPKCPVSEEMDR